MALKLILVLLVCANLIRIGHAKEGPIGEAPFLIGYVQKLQTYVVNVRAPPKDDSGNSTYVHGWEFDIAEPPYMVVDLTGERLCFAQTSKLTCVERPDSGKVEGRFYPTPPHSRIISVNFPRPQTNDYEVVYTSRKKVEGKWTVFIKMFDSNSNSSVTIHQSPNIYEENIAVDTNNWFVFFEDVNHEQIWYVDLTQGVDSSLIPQKYTEKTTKGNHRISTIAVDIKAGVLYNMIPRAVYSWRYLNETNTTHNFDVYENEQKSHLSLSADGKLFHTRHLSKSNFSLVSQDRKKYYKQFFPKQQGNSTLFFGTAIFRNQNKINLDTSCPRFCRLNKNGNCICWCPNEKPLLNLDNECKPLVVLTAEKSTSKVLFTSAKPSDQWNWLENFTYGNEPIAYNALENRLCQPKLNTETKKNGLWCVYKNSGKGRWIPEDATSEKGGANVLYPVNQAANTNDIYWMAEAENETQSLWALENGRAKNMKVYVKEPKHVAVDSFRQILFWCTEINGKVQLRWQAFNRTGKKPDCFQRRVFKATECKGIAVSEVQTKVFILSQDTIYQATYGELQMEQDIRNHIFKFSSIKVVRTIKGFSYHSGNLIWFNPTVLPSWVVILQAFDDDKPKSRKPFRVIPIKKDAVTQVQALMPHFEIVKTTEQCEGLSVDFAGICNGLEKSGRYPPETCVLVTDLPPTTTEPTVTPAPSTTLKTTQAPIPEVGSSPGPNTTLEAATFGNSSTTLTTTTTPPKTPPKPTSAPVTNATTKTEEIPNAITASTIKPTPKITTTQENTISPHATEVTNFSEQTPKLDSASSTTTSKPDHNPIKTNASGTEAPITTTTQSTIAKEPETSSRQPPGAETTLGLGATPTTPKSTTSEPVPTEPSQKSKPNEVPTPTSIPTPAEETPKSTTPTSSTPNVVPPPSTPIPPQGSPDSPGSPQTGIPSPKIKGPSVTEPPTSSGFEAVPIILALLAILCIIGAFFIFRRYQQNKSQYSNAISVFLDGSESLLESARDTAERSLYVPFASIISTNHVVIEHFKHLREGAFSIACLGAHAGNDVVIETLKQGLDIATFKFILHNLKLLVHIGQHNHVIEFFGAEISAIQTGVICAVLEHSLQGPLTNVLGEMRRNLGSDNETGASNRQDALPNLITWSSQIAQGLQHLWSKNIVHGSISASNVRVTDNNIVKISVFGHIQTQFAQPKSGTSIKTIDESNFRWAAPETLERSEYSFKADVWSYGVTVWEIFSFGSVPYGNHEYNPDFVKEIALGGLRLQKPQLMTDDIYNSILVPCWRTAPSDRSSVAQVNESWQQRLDRIK